MLPPQPRHPSSSNPPTPAAAVSADAIFNSAPTLPAEERPAYLAQACGDDNALRVEVLALLKAHEAADAFMRTGAPFSPGDRVGPYKLREQIGEGGLGTFGSRSRSSRCGGGRR